VVYQVEAIQTVTRFFKVKKVRQDLREEALERWEGLKDQISID